MKDPNQKGCYGELMVCAKLISLGLSVFQLVSKNSRADIVAIDGFNQTYKIQVKTTNSINGYAKLNLRKCCLDSRYNSYYTASEIDVFALYVIDMDAVVFVNAPEALASKYAFTFRFKNSKNNQEKGVRSYADYLHFPTRDLSPGLPLEIFPAAAQTGLFEVA